MSVASATSAAFGLGERSRTVLCMIGGPYVVRDGRRLDVPEGCKRLVVFVALHGGRVDRRQAAGALWPNGDDERAMGNLRSALWRLRRARIDVLTADMAALALCDEIDVDVTRLFDWAGRLIDGTIQPSDLRVSPISLEAVDLLPGWYDDWVIFERERLRQRLLHGLEALSRQLRLLRRWSEAVEAAMTAVNMEPLRESAQYVLAEAHVAEGNLVEARRCFSAYRALLLAELGIEPSQDLISLVQYGCVEVPNSVVKGSRGNGAMLSPAFGS